MASLLGNDTVQLVIVGGIGFLVYEFWDDIKDIFKLGDEVGKTVEKVVGELDPTKAVDDAGNLLDDLFSGDTSKTVDDFENLSGVLKPISGLTKGLEKALDIRQPSYKLEPWKDTGEDCNPVNLADYYKLSEYNDWRPDNCQEVIQNSIKMGLGSLGYIFDRHQNHLVKGVRNGQGGPAQMRYHVNPQLKSSSLSVVYRDGQKQDCPIQDYASKEEGVRYYSIGIAYILSNWAMNNLDDPSGNWTKIEKTDLVDILNNENFSSNYLTGNFTFYKYEKAFIDQLGLNVIEFGQFLQFSVKP
jgi:hypothetical protein